MLEIKKGQLVDVNRLFPNMSDLLLVIDWETKERRPDDFLIDSVLFLLNESNRVDDISKMIYLNNKEIRNDREAVVQFLIPEDMMTDNRNVIIGKEQFNIILDSLQDLTKRVKIGIGVYKGEELGYDLGMLKYLKLDMYDGSTKERIASMELKNFFTTETCVLMGDIYHHLNHLWKFKASGEGYKGSISSLYTVFADTSTIEYLD